MKLSIGALVLPLLLLAAAPAAVADDAVLNLPIAEALQDPDLVAQMGETRFYFGNQSHPAVARTIQSGATTSLRSTRCPRAMASALLRLKAAADRNGGNAVINIRSNWQNQPFSSTTEYQCGSGRMMKGVALIGDVVQLR